MGGDHQLGPWAGNDVDKFLNWKTPLYIFSNDSLRVAATTSLSSIVVGFSGIMLNSDGQESVFEFQVAPGNNRVEVSNTASIGAGWLLRCHCYLVSGTASPQALHVSARIIRES